MEYLLSKYFFFDVLCFHKEENAIKYQLIKQAFMNISLKDRLEYKFDVVTISKLGLSFGLFMAHPYFRLEPPKMFSNFPKK